MRLHNMLLIKDLSMANNYRCRCIGRWCWFTSNSTSASKFVPKASVTFSYTTSEPSSSGRVSSKTKSHNYLSSITGRSTNELTFSDITTQYVARKRKLYLRWSLYFFAVIAACGAIPQVYRSICLDQQDMLHNNNNATHKDIAPLLSNDERLRKRLIQVDFDACVLNDMPWVFRPAQKRLVITPGETALAFYIARNVAGRPVTGYSVYTVTPTELSQYVNKVQCFCFEEQLLSPGEEAEFPVLFYIDPEVLDEPRLANVDRMTLTYIYYETDSEIPQEYLQIPHIRDQMKAQGRIKELPLA